MNTISFISANFVARQLGYRMTEGWMQGDSATNDYFRPIDTFAERFDAMLGEAQAMGFSAIDIWLAHLHWTSATDEHIAAAREALQQRGLSVPSLAGGFGATPAEFESACRLARALGADVLAGMTPLLREDRPTVIALLREYDVKLGLENHPEKTPEEMLAQIGDGAGGLIGTAIDTGWYGTQGYDAAQAIERLRDHIVHVHLKDVRAPGGHETCRYGAGCVPIEACVQTLKAIGYRGPIGVEHEPELHDPTEDCIANLGMLREWLAA
jgi:sugar phosphate isomerase/epimerase